MKRYLVNGKGIDQLRIEEASISEQLNAYEVMVEVKACSLNYRDLLVSKGQYGPNEFTPFVPVSDMSGIVKAVGISVSDFKEGDRVINSPFRNWPAGLLQSSWARTFIGGAGVDGVLAENIIFPAQSLIKIPDFLSFEEASTLPIAGLTAWAAIVTHGKTRPGDWVLLEGTGGVSIFSAQIAQAIGAQIILLTANEAKSKQVKEKFGVKATFNYRDEDWAKQVKSFTQGKGVDVVVDTAGGAVLSKAIKICSYGARIGIIGLLSGTESLISSIDIIQHQITLRGIYMESMQELGAFMKGLEAIHLKPVIDKVFAFNDIKSAYHYLESQQHIGKVVITL